MVLYLFCSEILQIRYAYELLTNPLWKRDYDLFGIDEQLVSTFAFFKTRVCSLQFVPRVCVSFLIYCRFQFFSTK